MFGINPSGNSSAVKVWTNTELEQELESRNQSHLRSATETAVRLAEESKPRSGESLTPYQRRLEAPYVSDWQYARRQLQAREFQRWNEEDERALHEKAGRLEERIAEKRHKAQTHKVASERIQETYNWTTYRVVIAVLVIAAVFMGIFDGRSLAVGLGDNLLIAMGLGLLIGGSISFLAKVLPRVNEKWFGGRRMTALGLSLLSIAVVFSVTYLIGGFRADVVGLSMSGETAATGSGKTALVFGFFNAFIYSVELLVCFMFMPTISDEQKRTAKREHEAKMRALLSEADALDKELEAMRDELERKKQEREQLAAYESYLYSWIRSMATQCVQHFVSENMIHRADGYEPAELDPKASSFPDFSEHHNVFHSPQNPAV